MRNQGPIVVDLFCGAGGFSRGFKLEKFNIIFGLDNSKAPARTFKANFPEAFVLVEDIKNVDPRDVYKYTEIRKVDVVIGSPPCEPFTAANPNRMKDPLDRLYKDPNGQLVLYFIRFVEELKPKIFVMENVPGIAEDGLREALIEEFERAGYREVYFNKLRAEDYGTPSHRLRVFISNVRLKPRKTRPRTVKEALEDLPEPGAGSPPNHDPTPLSGRKLKRISRLRWGQALIKYRGAKRLLPNLIRPHPYRIAPTVLGSSRFIHPFEDRFLTVREQARLMGFPDYHVFLGGRDEQYNQIGEAVPVPLARAIARFIYDLLTT